METEEIRQRAQEVFDLVAPRISEEDLARVVDAFEFAAYAHREQKRKSGEPYIVHPIAVAKIVAGALELDANSVIAAFLHDVVEDTDYTIEDIRDRFGDDVAFLVDVVTKRKKTQDGQSKQVENYRQILDSVHYDIRALMVKLADRLHNMRTLDSMRPDKQMKIAGETDFFYAPLANRLGLYRVKSELENLSFRFRCPREFEMLDHQLAEDKAKTKDGVDAIVRQIEEIFKERKVDARIEVRYRRPYSIWRNMQEDGVDFSHVEFKHYIRVIYKTAEGWSEKDTSLFIYSVLTDNFKERPGSVVNYIDRPKENGYQSFHVKLLGPLGTWEELHISSERMLRNSRFGCIAKTNEESMNQWLSKLHGVLMDMADSRDPESFMKGVSSSFYNEDIFVLTPKGRVVILPKGATALDFAYELHSTIGDHAQYARINGRLCSIKSTLTRGDCVEIGTSDDVRPSLDWLDAAKTYKAQRHVRSSLRHIAEISYLRCRICHPLPGDEVIGYKEEDGRITIHSRHCPEAVKLASENGDAIVAVSFEENEELSYPVRIMVVAIDRYHLLRDLLDCISKNGLSLARLTTDKTDQIVHCDIEFSVHSSEELRLTLERISAIPNVDEVKTVDID